MRAGPFRIEEGQIMRIIITAGGTGGHIMPAVAIAEAIKDKLPDVKILFVGTDRGMEERIARLHGLDFIPIHAQGLKGKSIGNLLNAVSVNIKALIKALHIVWDFYPSWVIGTGGYVTGIVVLAGWLIGSKCAIQEQNSIPGLTNRLLSRLASRVFLAFPDSQGRFSKARTLLVGNPLRKELAQKNETYKGQGYLLILGGSLGASSINRASVKALEILKSEGYTISVIHQCGSSDYEWVEKAYREIGIAAWVHNFIDDMAPVYQGARLTLSRAGGITLSELSAIGIPAIIVPFPHATDDHQTANARYVAAKGGGWIIPDNELTPERLALEIRSRFFDDEGLKKAAANMHQIGLGAGAETIAREIVRV
jgi:UDP-N-acetylglucosamine--N-acetylmuramyl-(pentapeptide) pyrophosphoryl-undecaprenol N-acetylglucosamine transferase